MCLASFAHATKKNISEGYRQQLLQLIKNRATPSRLRDSSK